MEVLLSNYLLEKDRPLNCMIKLFNKFFRIYRKGLDQRDQIDLQSFLNNIGYLKATHSILKFQLSTQIILPGLTTLCHPTLNSSMISVLHDAGI